MDSAGRLVLPKAIREQAGLRPGQPLEVRCDDGRVELRAAPLQVEIADADDGLPIAVAKEPVEILTTDTVRETLL